MVHTYISLSLSLSQHTLTYTHIFSWLLMMMTMINVLSDTFIDTILYSYCSIIIQILSLNDDDYGAKIDDENKNKTFFVKNFNCLNCFLAEIKFIILFSFSLSLFLKISPFPIIRASKAE